MNDDKHISDLLPGFVLGALNDAETVHVAEHLAKCSECRVELQGYQEVVDQISMAAPESEPPEALKEIVLGQIKTRSKQNQPSGSSGGLRWWTAFFRSAQKAWAAAALALVAILMISNLLLWQQLNNEPADDILRVVELAGTEFAPLASGVIVMSRDRMRGTLVVDGLPPLSEDQIYQLWFIQADERESGGVFSVYQDGYGYLGLKSEIPLTLYERFGITVEPAGGSPGPTGLKVLGGDME
jgi:anti-sigma-K factor RskA